MGERAWVIRAGRHGERDAWALQSGHSGGGWVGVPNLTPCRTREEVAQVVAETFKGASDARIANFSGQLWALRGRIAVGDLVAMPLKTTKQIALGRVTGSYEYRADEEDPARRHVVPVDWQRVDLPRSAVKQDLLFTLGSAMSIFSPSKNDAVARLEALLKSGTDPGRSTSPGGRRTQMAGTSGEPVEGVQDVDEPELSPDIEDRARIQISGRIEEEFKGHGLTSLVAALLEAEGFSCETAPPGRDGGVDISAGRGPLGLDDMIVVQVKSGGQVGAPIVSQLHGVMSERGVRQGLLVAWDGLSEPAKVKQKANQLRVRIWNSDDVVDEVLAHYEELDEDIRSRLPLKRVWMLADGGN